MSAVDLASLLSGESIDVSAEGWSMWPAIRDGDVVRVEPIRDREPRRGDVVLSVSGEQLVLHRVTYVGAHVVTQGDTMPYPDAALRRVQVLGRATACTRGGVETRIATRRWRHPRAAKALRHALRVALPLRDLVRRR